jgi:hypothetical protein
MYLFKGILVLFKKSTFLSSFSLIPINISKKLYFLRLSHLNFSLSPYHVLPISLFTISRPNQTDPLAPFGLMKYNGMKRNKVEWNEMERNKINISFHCLSILRREQN